ncbi:MAG TPA: hypothetical protein VLJ39_09495, partial [Tepidisphaeraceae bacterium]|nr:hypothetical protein [Tepidisphaeraceae bacterium]
IAAAQSGPAINPPPPMALRQGESIEVTLSGQHLDTVTSVPVSDAQGVKVELAKLDKPKSNELHLKIAAAPDAALGDRELRLVAPGGVTKPVRVFISQFPVAIDKEPNNTPAEAQEIALPATVLGRIEAAGDIDQFRFNAKKGQTLIFDVSAARAGSPLEAVATVHSAANGHEMRSVLERHGGDPVLIFQPPEDGEYRLRVRDLEYRGGGEYDYRIVAGELPFVESILPSSARPGETVTAVATGYNLRGAEKIAVDLSHSAPGRIEVRAKTAAGFSNPVPFEVTDLPQSVESEGNGGTQSATPISLPAEVSAHLSRPGDEGFFKVHLAYKQIVSFQVLAGRYGSPVIPLLQLRNAQGNAMERNDGTPDSDARIVRELEAGDYYVSVRDLTFAGGPGYWYRLKVQSAVSVPQDFSARFLPDAPRLHRGGNVAIWCELKRMNGFKGEVTITPEGLPSGVTAQPVTLGAQTSTWFTLSAAQDAALGSAPIHFRASATIGTAPVSHEAEPELDGRVVKDAYLTVLEPAPFQVEAIAAMTPQRIQQLNGEIQSLSNKLNTPGPKFDSALAEWEKKASDMPSWTVLDPAEATSAKGTPLTRQSDGSFMASGNIPEQDSYTVTAHTDLKGITAVRLEVLADDRLPNHGPGAAPNGNFVLTEFKLFAAKEGEPGQAVALKNAAADMSQDGFPVANAIDGNPATGWAVMPGLGQTHTAVFQTATPVGSAEGTTLKFVLEHQSGFAQHIIGRLRLSVTTADPARLNSDAKVPAEIQKILQTSADDRSAEQKQTLAGYFRTIDPSTAPERARLEALRSFAEPYAEIDRLQNALKGDSLELKKQQDKWERSVAAGETWTALKISAAKAQSGALLQQEKDGSIFVSGPNPSNDVYELTGQSSLKAITAIRLEALPDPRLPGNGPGRAQDGNFVLTRFTVSPATGPNADGDEIALASAKASFEQEKYGIAGVLDDKDDTGWAIGGQTGRPVEATFYPKQPITRGRLTIRLEQKAKLPQYTLGRFRIWVTANKQPDAAARVPTKIAAILKAKPRSKEQFQELSAYFKAIAPSLEPIRERLADLREQVPSIPLKIARNRNGAIPVPIDRTANFAGEVKVTLEGFAEGREGNSPASIGKEFKINPLSLSGDKGFGVLTFEPQRREQAGSGMVYLKAEAKIGDQTVTEYSQAFPLTIEK